MSLATGWAEAGYIPDALIRFGIRRLLARTLADLRRGTPQQRKQRAADLLLQLRSGPIAIEADAANRQHYEVPAEFFHLVLGPMKKYSCCYWPPGVTSLDAAEVAMLELTAQRAQIEDGMEIFDLGCGWGSFALWAAARYPNARVTGLSNSHGQREYILARARERQLDNLQVITANAAGFDTEKRYDRIVSVEMLEHTRNTEALFARMARWLLPDGRLFVHVFTNRDFFYTFDSEDGAWMSSEFFSGGMMPSDDLYLAYQQDLQLVERWMVSGDHYAKTLRAWLDRLDRQHREVLQLFESVPGIGDARRAAQRWRLFFMGCEESFAYEGGEQWRVAHYLFKPK